MKLSGKHYVFDLDGTLCHTPLVGGVNRYDLSTPLKDRIDHVNKLYDEDNEITIWTARGASTGLDWYAHTFKQLVSWDLKFHRLILGKPQWDLYVCDKSINSEDYFNALS